MKGFECPHGRRKRMRVICRDGSEQVAEVCLDCDANARGPGKWVPRSQVPERVGDLPVWKDLRTPEEKGQQPTLF